VGRDDTSIESTPCCEEPDVFPRRSNWQESCLSRLALDCALMYDLLTYRCEALQLGGRWVGLCGPPESEMAYIVVVEHNNDVAEVVCEALRSERHRCFVIRSKAGAERVFRRVRPVSSYSTVSSAGWGRKARSQISQLTQPAPAGNLSMVFQEILSSTGSGRVPVQFLFSNAVHGAEGPIDRPDPPAQK
jgi:hypothetical protein